MKTKGRQRDNKTNCQAAPSPSYLSMCTDTAASPIASTAALLPPPPKPPPPPPPPPSAPAPVVKSASAGFCVAPVGWLSAKGGGFKGLFAAPKAPIPPIGEDVTGPWRSAATVGGGSNVALEEVQGESV